jgi:hypothetical protein
LKVLASKKVPPGGITGADMTAVVSRRSWGSKFVGRSGRPGRTGAGVVDITYCRGGEDRCGVVWCVVNSLVREF